MSDMVMTHVDASVVNSSVNENVNAAGVVGLGLDSGRAHGRDVGHDHGPDGGGVSSFVSASVRDDDLVPCLCLGRSDGLDQARDRSGPLEMDDGSAFTEED